MLPRVRALVVTALVSGCVANDPPRAFIGARPDGLTSVRVVGVEMVGHGAVVVSVDGDPARDVVLDGPRSLRATLVGRHDQQPTELTLEFADTTSVELELEADRVD